MRPTWSREAPAIESAQANPGHLRSYFREAADHCRTCRREGVPYLLGWGRSLEGLPGRCGLTRPSALRHGDDDLAACMSLLHMEQTLGRVGQWVRPVDDRRELPGLDEPSHGEQLLPVLPGRERAEPLRDERIGDDRPQDAGNRPEHVA